MLKIFRILILFSITPAILYGPALPDTSLKYIHLRKSLTTFSPTKKKFIAVGARVGLFICW